jgi:hypothetical protein
MDLLSTSIRAPFAGLNPRLVFVDQLGINAETKVDFFFVTIGAVLKKIRAKKLWALEHLHAR